MTEHLTSERLNGLVDGDLPPRERAAVDRHLAGCVRCRAELARWRSLQRETAELPRLLEPDRDLWPEIEARLARREAGPTEPWSGRARAGAAGEGRWGPRPALLAAASLVILAATLVGLFRAGGSPGQVAAGPESAAALEAFAPAESEYRAAVAMLRDELDSRRHRLAPSTLALVEEHLALLNEAVHASRSALDADPDNPQRVHHVARAYHEKIALLQATLRYTVDS